MPPEMGTEDVKADPESQRDQMMVPCCSFFDVVEQESPHHDPVLMRV